MALHFLHPWLVLVAAALAVVAGALLTWRRKFAPFLFTLAAAAFFLGGARPLVGDESPDVRHALVVDVSGSMEGRQAAVKEFADRVAQTELPAGHSFVRFELSDALRQPGGVRGQGTDYARLRDLAADDTINGEVIFVTDGRGSIKDLYGAIDPQRLILIRAPEPRRPDAAVVSLTTPTFVTQGGIITARASIRCDADAKVTWRMLIGDREMATGEVVLRANVPAMLARSTPVSGSGLQRVRLLLNLPGDREARNDQASSAFIVGGKREVLYCAPDAFAQSDALLQALTSDEANHVRTISHLPLTSNELDSIGVVVINNLSLAQAGATQGQLQVLADWVNGGGNLLMVGTEGAFGPGGYRGSPLESLMPVRFRPDDSPPRQLLLLLDVSASMNDPLPGGGSKLQRLKQAAWRVLETVGEDDRVAIVGFRERMLGDVDFLRRDDVRLAQAIDGLQAGGTTHIGTSLRQATGAFHARENNGILIITDGDDVENAGQAVFETVAQNLAARKTRLDIVLTSGGDQPWADWIISNASAPDAHLWTVGGEGFEGLLETLEHALAGQNLEWVLNETLDVAGTGTALSRVVRTAPRDGAGVRQVLSARTRGDNPASYPLLATRQLVGRTACLCTDSWGDAALAAFWGDAAFQHEFAQALGFLLENANSVKLVLNPLPDGAELVWTGGDAPPTGDLQTDTKLNAQYVSPGRWLLDSWPSGEQLTVLKDGRLLQRIPLPSPVPTELRYTGDDPVFFEAASAGGIRVFSGLGAWQPRSFAPPPEKPVDVTWLAALLALLCLLAGFALRRR